jgi:hypothetical protein
VTDYWLSKFFFDLQRQPERAARYKTDRAGVLSEYPLTSEVCAAVLADDVATLAPRTNPYLLRYYFAAIGMSDAVFIERLRGTRPQASAGRHG